MFDGFRTVDVDVPGTTVHAVVGGEGPPLLLLHGYPQTHVMWHRVAPELARRHTVVAADLRGYGDSGAPGSGVDNAGYAKRAMAADQVSLMRALGFERFAVAGHDRGARVTHRMCLDHPDAVTRAAVLDIVPTRHVYANVDRALAQTYYHWFFLAQPHDLPERLIGGDPGRFLRSCLVRWSADAALFDQDALAEYLRCFDATTVHASCADYRAAAGIDLAHDESDVDSRIGCPLLVLWGAEGFVGRTYDVLDVWRRYATDVRGTGLPCGHFLPEEDPAGTLDQLTGFLADD